jgi:hypothetical protein
VYSTSYGGLVWKEKVRWVLGLIGKKLKAEYRTRRKCIYLSTFSRSLERVSNECRVGFLVLRKEKLLKKKKKKKNNARIRSRRGDSIFILMRTFTFFFVYLQDNLFNFHFHIQYIHKYTSYLHIQHRVLTKRKVTENKNIQVMNDS